MKTNDFVQLWRLPRMRLLVIILAVLMAYPGYLIGSYIMDFRRSHSSSVPVCPDCNIIMIVVDPLRADSLHTLGNPLQVTPTLDALAKQGYLFTNAVTVSSWTLPSAMSLMTGTYPSVHKIVNKELIGRTEKEGLIPASLRVASPELSTMATVLKANGYVTGGFAGGAALHPSYGFNQGFDTYMSPGEFEGLPNVMPEALDFIRSHTNDRMFIFLHGFDTHGQYEPSEEITKKFVDASYRGNLTGSTEEQKAIREEGVMQQEVHLTPSDTQFLRAIYDEKIERADTQIASFLAAYRAMNVTRKTIIIITSDHGDEFYEHGRIDHGMTLYDEVIRVPLAIVLPGTSTGVRVTDQMSNIDVMPTVFALVGVTPPMSVQKQMEGVSLVPTMQGVKEHRDVFTETVYRYATHQYAVRTWDGWKLIYDQESSTSHLFNLRTDSGELTDLARVGNPKEQELMTKLVGYINDVQTRIAGSP